ncbi:hypothetical protein GWK47_014335 [Chionoecetes opilio]|uniref:Uncharacterized protein n=1 Tax=Chionoecetes opilio TaxID=41210 RepID=A0A8J4XUT2_CHIOP|nr:hypothetical protein GWK47_014335 [Chionoecetes opilio]
MTPEKRKSHGVSVEEKEEKRRSCGGGVRGASRQLVERVADVEQQVEAEMAELRRRTHAVARRLRLLGRADDSTPTPTPIPTPKEKDTHAPTTPRAPRGTPEGCRARSEPPLPAEEGLYRARSCPGLPRPVVGREGEPIPDLQLVRLRGTRGATTRPPPLNRYSCGALDGRAPPTTTTSTSVTFESCPDLGSLRQCVRQRDSQHSSSSSLSSTHSFTRLLQVS